MWRSAFDPCILTCRHACWRNCQRWPLVWAPHRRHQVHCPHRGQYGARMRLQGAELGQLIIIGFGVDLDLYEERQDGFGDRSGASVTPT